MAKKIMKAAVPLEQRFRQEPGLLAKYLADPGLRSQLPDKFLTPAQRQQRTIARDPYHKPVQAAATQQFGGAIDRLQQTQRNAGDWFKQYQDELGKSRDRQKALQDATTQSVADRSSSFASMNNQANQQQQAGMQADAATRGATVDPSVAKVAGDANTVREALGKQSANTLATQGASNNAAAEAALSAAFGQEAVTRSKLDQELRDLLRDRDAFKVTARGDLVAAEQKARLEAKAFGLDSITKINPKTGLPYEIDPETGRPFPKPMSEGDKAAKARNDFFKKHGYYPPTGPPKPPKAPKKTKAGQKQTDEFQRRFGVKPATGDQVRGAMTGLGKAGTTLSNVLGIKAGQPVDPAKPDGEKWDVTGRALGYKQLVDMLVNQGVDQLWANVVADKHKLGGKITRGTARRLHAAGFTAKQLGLKVQTADDVMAQMITDALKVKVT